MGNRYLDRHQYFDELVETSTAYYVDYLRRFISIAKGTRVLEVGCGEGGNLLPFALIGCEVIGVDYSGKKIANARNYFQENGAKGGFFLSDFFDFPVQDKPFDAILVHDVIEHIAPEHKESFLDRIHSFLAPDGVAFLAFPAWQMPFGGHQQTCKAKGLRILPYVHLFPLPAFRKILQLFNEPEGQIKELLEIRSARMTVEKFEGLCKKAGYQVCDRTLWFLNPHYQAKFGLRPVKLRLGLDKVPYIRNWLSTSCWYVLR